MKIGMTTLLVSGLCVSASAVCNEFVPAAAPDKVHQEVVEEKICIEQRGSGSGGCLRPINFEFPEKAKFVLDNDLLAKVPMDPNRSMWLTEQAYHTLISAGDYARLPAYWDMLYREVEVTNNPHWFRLDFALSESQKAAVQTGDQGIAGQAQLRLARYYLHGCPQHKLQGTDHTDASHGPDQMSTLFGKIGAQCHPEAAQVVKWFTLFANNPTSGLSDTQLQSSQIGDWYFNRKQYAEALGWYIATIKIAEIDPNRFARSDAAKAFHNYAQQYLLAGNSMTDADYQAIASKSVATASGEYLARAEAAKRRVALLQEMRVQAVASYD